jgi:hypothetical protein
MSAFVEIYADPGKPQTEALHGKVKAALELSPNIQTRPVRNT